jgi:hypothetical protein
MYKSVLLAWLLLLPVAHGLAADEQWLFGKWELTYDPDGGEKDYLEFHENGDAYSTGRLGRQEGFYVVSEDSVKAVFTYKGKDFIMTFHFNEAKDELRIVTSHTGRASVYNRVKE